MSFKIFEDEKALSTSTATLILVAISIFSAAAIGLMMGSFAEKEVSHANDIASNISASELSALSIRIGGSTTCQPVVKDSNFSINSDERTLLLYLWVIQYL